MCQVEKMRCGIACALAGHKNKKAQRSQPSKPSQGQGVPQEESCMIPNQTRTYHFNLLGTYPSLPTPSPPLQHTHKTYYIAM